MKFLTRSIFIFTFCAVAEAAQFSLIKIDTTAYDAQIKKINEAIKNDDTKQEILPFEKDQSFVFKGAEGDLIGYLIPVKFNSKSYKNTICRLYFLNLNNKLTYAELFAEKNDGEEVVSSCVGIEAVSIQEISGDEVNYLAILRYRTVNTYSSRGVVVNYKKGNISYDKKLNGCVNSSGSENSIRSLKKKILSCK